MKRFNMSTISSVWYLIQLCDRTKEIAEATNRNALNAEKAYKAIERSIGNFKEKTWLERSAGSDFAAAMAPRALAHENR